jgi:hypothetical protein
MALKSCIDNLDLTLKYYKVTRWVFEKVAYDVAQPFLVQIPPWKKVAQEFAPLLSFSNLCPK